MTTLTDYLNDMLVTFEQELTKADTTTTMAETEEIRRRIIEEYREIIVNRLIGE